MVLPLAVVRGLIVAAVAFAGADVFIFVVVAAAVVVLVVVAATVVLVVSFVAAMVVGLFSMLHFFIPGISGWKSLGLWC